MTVIARLAHHPLDPEQELARFAAALVDTGAIVSFTGLVRPETHAGDDVASLFLDHHDRLTERSLAEIAGTAATRFDISDILVVHRCGTLAPGDPIVVAAAASVHRRAAFDAVDYLIDRLKSEAMLWKREDSSAGSRWIEPTDADRNDLARWSASCPE